jgi:hypothetical protein
MIYNETYIGIATNVDELIVILRTKVPAFATIEQAVGDRSPDVEVWYDKGTNTVILK